MTTFNGFNFEEGTMEEKQQLTQTLVQALQTQSITTEEFASLMVEMMDTLSELSCELHEDDENSIPNSQQFISDMQNRIESFIQTKTTSEPTQNSYIAYIWSDTEMVLGEEKQADWDGGYVVLNVDIQATSEEEALAKVLEEYDLDLAEDEVKVLKLAPYSTFINENSCEKKLHTHSSHQLNESASISDIESYVESLNFNELCHTLSTLIGYEIGDLRESSSICGFWNDEAEITAKEEDWQAWREAGRVRRANERTEVLWYWDEDDMKELVTDCLYGLKQENN